MRDLDGLVLAFRTFDKPHIPQLDTETVSVKHMNAKPLDRLLIGSAYSALHGSFLQAVTTTAVCSSTNASTATIRGVSNL